MNEWLLIYDEYDPERVGVREALCTLGNGYFATRGALATCDADDVHYPGTYIAGVYNRLDTEVAGRRVDNESLVNVPNWLPVRFCADDGPCFSASAAEVLWQYTELDMYRGVLSQKTRYRDPEGRVLRVTERRFVSMRDPHMAGIEVTAVPENWSGRLNVLSAIDGTVTNSGVARYAALGGRHLVPVCTDHDGGDVVCLRVETSQSEIRIAEAARTRVFHGGEQLHEPADLVMHESYVGLSRTVDVSEGEEVTVEKIVSLFTSRDHGIGEPGEEACATVREYAGGFDDLLSRHAVSWRHIWGRVRIDVGANHGLALALHVHLFHLCQTVSNNSIGIDAGVPARGLHGEAYRGHIFWDELFIVPLLSLRLPQLARSLLIYRYNRIDRARNAAADCGYSGAMYPWQSASDGREQTQTMHLNPNSGRWLPDASHLQRHVNAAIVHNVWHYYLATLDLDFLRFYGAEMILEIARFWSSIATYNRALDRYEIKGVMGPDEYHEGYPGRDGPGLDNNAYTNLMAVWCLCRAFDVLRTLPPVSVRDLRERLMISEQELDRWGEVSRKMRVCFHDGDVISQFEGYEDLLELDWDAYRAKYGDIHRLDRILESEGDSPNRYKLTKQADVMMLFYLLSPNEIATLLERLGYPFDDDLIERNIEYYEARTAHGSTLSRVVHAWINANRDREKSWDFFLTALNSDLDDIQGGTTREGIHLGAMAGTVDILHRCYTGLEMRGEVLHLDPVLPLELGSLAFDIRYRGHLVHLEFTTEVAKVRVDLDEGEPVLVDVKGELHKVGPGQTIEVSLVDGDTTATGPGAGPDGTVGAAAG